MLGLTDMLAASAAARAKATVGIEGVIECGHQLLRVGALAALPEKCNRCAITKTLTKCRNHLLHLAKKHLAGRANRPDRRIASNGMSAGCRQGCTKQHELLQF
jgi:hypothetical protein